MRTPRKRKFAALLRGTVAWGAASIFAVWTYYLCWQYLVMQQDLAMPGMLVMVGSSSGRDPREVVVALVMHTTFGNEKSDERRDAIAATWGTWRGDGRYRFEVRFLSDKEDITDSGAYRCYSEYKTECLLEGYTSAVLEFGLEALAFVLKVDDVTFVMPSRLFAFVSELGPSFPVAAGNLLCMHEGVKECFLSGGAGFLLTRESVRQILEAWPTRCAPKLNSASALRADDVSVASCLARETDVALESPADEDGELFNVFEPVTLAQRKEHPWYKAYKSNTGLKSAQRCCSPRAITFHYVEAPLARLLWACHRDRVFCPRDRYAWPQAIGGYARQPRSVQEVKLINMVVQSPA